MSTDNTPSDGEHRRVRVEKIGLDYDEMPVGQVISHRPGRTVTDADNIWFSLLTMNPQPLHIDAEYARGTRWGKPLVNMAFTLSTVAGMSVRAISARIVANISMDRVVAAHPVFVGDTLTAETEILDKRLSESRPGIGIVTVGTRGFNQHGTEVISFERRFMMETASGR